MAPMLEVTQQIKIDHDNVRDLFQRFKTESDVDTKKAIANTLVREMAIHGDAEEISVYNKYKEMGLGDVAEHNIEEHAEVKQRVYEADSAKFGSPDYDKIMSEAVTCFIRHAEEEENEQFQKIKAHLSPEENDKIAHDFLNARTMVPTRPHPSAPQTGGMVQKAAGLQGSIYDKIVETAQGRNFVDLKFSHPEI